MTTQRTAKLRVCMSCEWIFNKEHTWECPKCGMGSYGARCVYGNKAYTYKRTQEPWFEKQMAKVSAKLQAEIKEDACCYRSRHTRGHHHDEGCRNWVTCF